MKTKKTKKGRLTVCSRGHQFHKNSDQPVCPKCWPGYKKINLKMQSKAKTVKEYLEELPEDRRVVIGAVRKVVLKNLPKGYQEGIQWGMICYSVPLKLYPRGYGENKEVQLPYLALGSQKNYMAVYLMNIYAKGGKESWFAKEYKATGKKLDMGKGCVRFKKLDDLPLEVIAKAVALTPVKEWIAIYSASRKNKK